MPITVTDENGTVHNFPDEATPEMIAKVLGVGYGTQSRGGAGGTWTPETIGEKIDRWLSPSPEDTTSAQWGNLAKGAIAAPVQAIHHPIQTFGPLVQTVAQGGYPSPLMQQQLAGAVQQAQQYPNYTLGNLIGAELSGQAAPKLFSRGTPLPETTPVSAVSGVKTTMPDVIKGVADSFNPPAEIRPKFIEGFKDNIGNIQDWAQRNGAPFSTREDMMNAAKMAANERKAFYEQKILGPIEDESLAAPTWFKGNHTGTSSTWGTDTTTWGDLDHRLSEINNTLDPKYQKGGPAISAQETAALRTEAANIRKILYPKLEEATGIPAAEIQNLKQSYGQMNDFSGKARLLLDKENKAAVTQATKPLTLNPFAGNKGTAAFALQPLTDRMVNAAARAMGRPTLDSMFSDAIQGQQFPTTAHPDVLNQYIQSVGKP